MAYNKPDGPPPAYPPQAHYDAGPGGGDPRGNAGYYGSPPPQQYGSPSPYGPPGGQYGGPPQGGPYGPPQGGPYGPPQPGPYQQQPMYYQQQPYPPQGYQDNRGSGAGGGICAGILGALACCCCLDCLF